MVYIHGFSNLCEFHCFLVYARGEIRSHAFADIRYRYTTYTCVIVYTISVHLLNRCTCALQKPYHARAYTRLHLLMKTHRGAVK